MFDGFWFSMKLYIMTYEFPFRTFIVRYASYSLFLHRLFMFHCWNASDAPDILVLSPRALLLEMPRLPALVASLTHLGNGGSGGLLSWHRAEMSGVLFSVIVIVVTHSTGANVMVVTLVALRQFSCIWFCRHQDNKGWGGMDCNNLLPFGRLLSRTPLSIGPELLLRG